VLVPAPDYPLWTASVNLAGGKAVHYLCERKIRLDPDISDLKKKITSKTKAIVVINPNNPTGALYPTDVLKQIARCAGTRAYGLFRRNLRQDLLRRY